MQDVAFPQGFSAAGTACGINKNGNPDAGLLVSEPPPRAFGAFSRNAAAAAPGSGCREGIATGKPVSRIRVHSGNATAATGERGYRDALDPVARLRAGTTVTGEVLVSSTGVIGEPLPMEALGRGIATLAAARDDAPFH